MKNLNFKKYVWMAIFLFYILVWNLNIVKAGNESQTTNSDIQIITSTLNEINETSATTEEIVVPTSTVPEVSTSTDNTSTTTDTITTTTIDTTTSTEVTTTTTTETTTSTEDTTTTTTETTITTSGSNENNPTPTTQNQLITTTQIHEAVNKILNYLKSQQDDMGKIIDGTITDWSIISFGSNNQYANDIKNNGESLLDYEKKYNLDDPSDLNNCASYPRHILALLATGVGKEDSTIQGLKNKIIAACYQNNLYGLNGINDDIFGLLSLLAVDTPTDEPIIIDIISTIKADQTPEGAFTWTGWAGVDMTGAAMNALKYAEDKGVIINHDIYSQAKQYLKINQLTDGGWGYGSSDILTTSWALMGINALNEGQNEWFTTSGTNPWYTLVNQLNENGYYESAWVPGTVDWFAMKHAIPALLSKSWPIILPEKIQNFSSGASFNYLDTQFTIPVATSSKDQTNTTTTSTIENVTTTLEVVTTTLDITTTTIQIPEETNIQNTTTTEDSYQLTRPVSTTSQNNTITVQKKQEQKNEELKDLNTSTLQQINNVTISSAPTTTPINTAKTVFGISLTAASGMGFYLAWRLLQTLL